MNLLLPSFPRRIELPECKHILWDSCKKISWKEWNTWKIHILNSWAKTAGSFFPPVNPLPHRIKKKTHSLILNLETKFQRNTLPWNMHEIPTEDRIKLKRVEYDLPVCVLSPFGISMN